MERVDLRGAAATLLVTLYLRGCDARSATPILGDPWAQPVMHRIDYDFSSMSRGNTPLIATRARQLDRWTRRFLDRHPDAQVLHLGCGLDSRPLRVRRPAGSRWIDVDRPEVVELRRRLYDLPPEVETIGASVTDPAWWDRVDPARPTIVVAEGLLMYVPADEAHALLDRAVEHLAGGQLVFDAVAAPWLVGVTHRVPQLEEAGLRFEWAAPATELLDRHPGLTDLNDESLIALVAEAAPRPWIRRAFTALARVPAMRDALRLHRYAFGPDPARSDPTRR